MRVCEAALAHAKVDASMPPPARPRHSGRLPSNVVLARLRGEQITALARRTGSLAICSITCFGMVVLTFWRVAPHRYLLGLLLFLVAMHGLAAVGSRIWLAKPTKVGSRRMLNIRVAITAIIAMAWATVPAMLTPSASPEQRQLLIYIGSGLMSSSIMMAPLLPAAVLFAGITGLGLLLPMPFVEASILPQHALTLLLFLTMTCNVVLNQSRDFTGRVLNELTLEEQGDIIGLLLREFEENANDFLWEIDRDLCLHRVSDRLAQTLGQDPATLHGTCMTQWVSPTGSTVDQHDNARLLACMADRLPFRDMQVWVTLKGAGRWLSITGKPLRDAAGGFAGYRGVASDITAARESNERIAYLARYDCLTGLPNRAEFHRVLARACAQGTEFGLLCLDLDGFKSVNDMHGHGTGDALLVAVAGRLRGCIRDGDLVARLGGDEFAIQSAGGEKAAASLAERLVSQLSEPYQIGNVSVTVSVSVGIALSGDSVTAQELLRGADLALYHSKASGQGRWHFFESEMAVRAEARHALQADLRHAIAQGGLTINFQPIFDLASGEVVEAEALVRWQHPVRGQVSPAEFIPIAEESGLIVPLGAWVLRRACEEAVTWAGQARVAVNLSPLQFGDPGLLALIGQVLSDTGLPAHRLELEITESVLLKSLDTTLACLHALRARGVHIALDDFGTGYSSLSYLRSFPFDKVKIDQSFIRDLGANDDAIAIVQAIVGMAGSLGMRTTGEGVETEEQAKMLQLTGCSQVQGYLFGRPCSPDAIAGVMLADTNELELAIPA